MFLMAIGAPRRHKPLELTDLFGFLMFLIYIPLPLLGMLSEFLDLLSPGFISFGSFTMFPDGPSYSGWLFTEDLLPRIGLTGGVGCIRGLCAL